MNKIHTQIISAFHGCGKTECYKKYCNPKYNYKVLDYDNSDFNIQYIIENIGKIDVIFCSSHKTVRDILKNNEIIQNLIKENKCTIYLAFPVKEQKQEYISRYKNRGSTNEFIKLLSDNWDIWIDSMMNDCNFNKFIMHNGFLTDFVFSENEREKIIMKNKNDFTKLSQEEKDKYCSNCGCTGGCNLCQK